MEIKTEPAKLINKELVITEYKIFPTLLDNSCSISICLIMDGLILRLCLIKFKGRLSEGILLEYLF